MNTDYKNILSYFYLFSYLTWIICFYIPFIYYLICYICYLKLMFSSVSTSPLSGLERSSKSKLWWGLSLRNYCSILYHNRAYKLMCWGFLALTQKKFLLDFGLSFFFKIFICHIFILYNTTVIISCLSLVSFLRS